MIVRVNFIIVPINTMGLFNLIFIAVVVAASMRNETADNGISPEYSWIAPSSPETIKNSANITVYLGHSNNPFGPSIRFQYENGKNNYTSLLKQLRLPYTFLSDKNARENSNENFVDVDQAESKENRKKRGIIHLYNMVSCATGCNPLIYKGYGCFCGFLGSGFPVDGIDRCCKKHDWCYDTSNCPTFLEYFVPYYWKCYHNRPLCALDHYEWGGAGSCAQRICECDKMLSECLSKYPCPTSRALCRSSPLRLLQNALMIF